MARKQLEEIDEEIERELADVKERRGRQGAYRGA